uniref:GTP_EFTU_D3 domain-containing protein n=1 Tax=Heterorhabditis bacteriophora TaxID=37862 RepID=A0A1I7XIB7_HETBA
MDLGSVKVVVYFVLFLNYIFMNTGASQADAAILVVNSTRGEFETGFENGGQTREHAMLLRSLVFTFLKVILFYLDKYFKAIILAYYDDMAFTLDSFTAPQRMSDGPLRIVVNDATTNQLSLSGKIESGEVEAGDKVYIMPNADAAIIKACSNDDGGSVESCIAGDQTLLTLSGTFEPDTIHAGHVIVRGGQDTLLPGRRYTARVVVFDVTVPIMKGTKAELYCHSLCEPCTVIKLISSINKANGKVLKERPRCLTKSMSGLVEIETDYEVAIEPYTNCRALGRITLRAGGQTIAAGIIEKKIT